MQGRYHSLRDHGAFHLALIAFVCVVMVLLSGSHPARLAGTDGLTRQIDDRVEQIEAPNHTAVPIVRLDIGLAEDLLEEAVAELTDDDETEHGLLRLDVAVFGSQTGGYDLTSSPDRALTPFRLLACLSRGSPSA